MRSQRRRPGEGSARVRRAAWLALAWACAPVAAQGLTPLSTGTGSEPPPPWQEIGLPMQKKPFTAFSVVTLDGQRVLKVEADQSYGNLVHVLPRADTGRFLSWRWRVDVPNDKADLRTRNGDDTAAEVCVLFDLPLSAVPFVDRQVVRLARLQSQQLLPSATVCYVWDAHFAPETALDNAYTRRIRMIVLRGAGTPLKSWQSERRDVHADFLRLFGDESRTVPDIIGIGIGADADNTRARSLSYVADLVFEP